MSFERLGVIGGGAWGTALAQVGASGGGDVLLWAREPEVVEAVNSGHENKVIPSGAPARGQRPGDRRTRGPGRLRRMARRNPRAAYALGARSRPEVRINL